LCSQSASFNIQVKPEPSLYKPSQSFLVRRFAHLTPLLLYKESYRREEIISKSLRRDPKEELLLCKEERRELRNGQAT
jgi:hypothetical protein